jgi:hypothetical protein
VCCLLVPNSVTSTPQWITRITSSRAPLLRNYRDPYQRNRQMAFLPACMSTSGRIHGEFLRLIFFISNKQADDYFAALGYQAHKEEFCHSRGIFFHVVADRNAWDDRH